MPIPTEQLQALPLMQGLSTVELEELASHLVPIEHAAGERIISEGDDSGAPIFFLLDGSVDVLKGSIDGRDHVISSLSAPSVFGEIEILARRPAIASVIAVTPVRLAGLHRGVFDELCTAGRTCALKVVMNLAQTLSYRLAATDERLAAYFSSAGPQAHEALGQMRSLLFTGHQSEA